MSSFFASEEFTTAMDILKNQFPLAIWETVYVTVLSTFFAAVFRLPPGPFVLGSGEGNTRNPRTSPLLSFPPSL